MAAAAKAMAEAAPDESLSPDTLLGGRVRLAQPAGGYRVAIDPVILAAAVAARPGQSVLDAGTGVGAAALCLLCRVPEAVATGIEMQPAFAALARRNGEANGHGGAFTVIDGDIAARPLAVAADGFDHVMANPPYRPAGRGTVPPDRTKAVATVEGPGGLGAWLDFCTAAARPGGTVTVIHRADRLDDLLAGFAGRLGGIVVYPLWPTAGKAAGRVVIAGVKGGRAALTLLPGLVLHEADGAYTAAADAILRGGAGLDLGWSGIDRSVPARHV